MNKIQSGIQQFRDFLSSVGMEMRKTTWPARDELVESTIVVIVSVLMLSLYIGVSDKLLVSLLKLLVPSG